MAIAYLYNAEGYYAGESEDFGLLPNNATYKVPERQAGYVPHWTGKTWEKIENHKGREGYLDGKQHTIKEFGPLPKSWSDTPPPPTPKEQASSIRAERDRRIAATDYLFMPDYPIAEQQLALVRVYRQTLRDLPEQKGFPWSGPDGAPWPALPEGLSL